MKKRATSLTIAATLFCTTTLVGCTQMPTEKQSISDMRPQIAFKAEDDKVRAARVLLDGLDMGAVGDFMDGSASLRILSGTHVLRVIGGDRSILDEKFYVGDGANRTFIVK